MKTKKIMWIAGLILLLGATWALCVTFMPRKQAQQQALAAQAAAFVADEIYIKAIPLYEEALLLAAEDPSGIVIPLADCYQKLGDHGGYVKTLANAVAAGVGDPSIYRMLAEQYLEGSMHYKEALTVLQEGYAKTGDVSLLERYEAERYRIRKSYDRYESVGVPMNGKIPAMQNGKWGYINYDGDPITPFIFDKATPYYMENAIAMDRGQAVLLDSSGRRLALCKTAATDVMPLKDGMAALSVDGAWRLANASFQTGETAWDFIGPYVDEWRAVCLSGSWELRHKDGETKSAGFQGLALDAQSVAYRQERAFGKTGDQYYLIDAMGNHITEESYDDARPFQDGWAAVKRQGLWGFIDTNGTVKLDFSYSDADSFSVGLAAVKKGELWGYITPAGTEAIPCQFSGAQSFVGGVAAVKTESGWSIVKLCEILD